jgi:hypothetical protein
MKHVLQHTAIILFFAFQFCNANGQDLPTMDFRDQIINFDISTVLTSDSIVTYDSEVPIYKRNELIGFIGDNYQRFFIHFISVIQNPTNPYEYLVFGKDMVKNNLCTFQGVMKITQSRLYLTSDIPNIKQGYAKCDVVLYEDKKQNFSGLIKGMLTCWFVIDEKGKLIYDATSVYADGFCNNQFVGKWTSYKTKESKTCNWGNDRIPECGDLDIGAGEFSVNEKYQKKGWENYLQAWVSDPKKQQTILARQKENQKWWIK